MITCNVFSVVFGAIAYAQRPSDVWSISVKVKFNARNPPSGVLKVGREDG